jgi:hypothetical protein
MAAWNYTSYGPLDVFTGANLLTGQLFGVSILVLLWLIVFFRNQRQSIRDTVIIANLITGIVAIIFGFLGILQDKPLWIALLLLFGSIALLIKREGQQ